MGILSNSAIIVLLACNGVIGAKGEVVGCQNAFNLPYYQDLPQVIDQALPLIKEQLNLFSIKVFKWENAQRKEVMGIAKWVITIYADQTPKQRLCGGTWKGQRKGKARQGKVIFEADQRIGSVCNDKVCIKNVHVQEKPAVDGVLHLNGVNCTGAKSEVVDWQYVTNLTDFRDLYEVIDQALPIIKEHFKLSSIEVLNWENAQRKEVMGGFKWVIKIGTDKADEGTAQESKVIFEADQWIASECENDKLACVKNVRVIKPANDGNAMEYSGYQDVPSFDHFRVIYKAFRPMLEYRRWNNAHPYIDVVGISEAKYQQLTYGTKWEIVTAIKDSRYSPKKVLNSTVKLLQLPTEYCEDEENICFEDADWIEERYKWEDWNNFPFTRPFTIPLSKSFSRRFNCCVPPGVDVWG